MKLRRILCGLLVAFLTISAIGADVNGTQLEQAQQEHQQLTEELNLLNQQLTQLSEEMATLEEAIATSKAEVVRLNEETQRLEEEKAQQYEDMKLRIQYTYENSKNDLFALLLESQSLAEFINRAEYITMVTNYDRNMVKNYESLIESIDNNKATVLAEQSRQEQLKQEIGNKQAQVLAAITNTQQSLADSQSQIDAYIAQIEAQEREEDIGTGEVVEDDSATDSGDNNEGSGDASGGEYTGEYEESDLLLLGALIECEAGGEPYEGKLAVGSVVINRVNSDLFPDTIVGVIYQPGQFTPASSGKLAAVLARGAKQDCIDAAREVLNGNITIDCLFFRVNDGRDGIVIGNHVFY